MISFLFGVFTPKYSNWFLMYFFIGWASAGLHAFTNNLSRSSTTLAATPMPFDCIFVASLVVTLEYDVCTLSLLVLLGDDLLWCLGMLSVSNLSTFYRINNKTCGYNFFYDTSQLQQPIHTVHTHTIRPAIIQVVKPINIPHLSRCYKNLNTVNHLKGMPPILYDCNHRCNL